MTRPHIVAFIFARGGSKGAPRKNIHPLNGKPLIAYPIETARACSFVDRIVVSTDDEEIAAAARACGAEVPFMRPAELATDTAPEWLAWQHAIRTLNESSRRVVEIFLSLPATAPLRAVQDVEACVQRLQVGDADLVLCVTEASQSPYFTMVTLTPEGYTALVLPSEGNLYRRQDAPPVYTLTSVAYAARPDYILSAARTFEGRVAGVRVPVERSLDIDTPWDLYIADLILRDRQAQADLDHA